MDNWKIITSMQDLAEYDGAYVAYIFDDGINLNLANLGGGIG